MRAHVDLRSRELGHADGGGPQRGELCLALDLHLDRIGLGRGERFVDGTAELEISRIGARPTARCVFALRPAMGTFVTWMTL